MSMTADKTTQRTFQESVYSALTQVYGSGPDTINIWAALEASPIPGGPCIRFDWAPPSLGIPEGAILWQQVDNQTFGNLTGDHMADAQGITANCYCDAIEDCFDAFREGQS